MKIIAEKKFKIKLLIIALFGILASSCVDNTVSVNDMFVKKYSKKVKEINQQRILPKDSEEEIVSSTPPSNEEISDFVGSQEKYQGYVPIYNVGEYVPKQFLPNEKTYNELSRNNPSNSVPSDIFEVNFITANYPPFSNEGIEFDSIAVPKLDAYGNSSVASEKKYLLATNRDIQNSITEINKKRSNDDLNISKILIYEKKQQIKTKKNEQIFAISDFEEVALIDDLTKEDAKKEDKKNATKKNNDKKNN